MQETPRLINDQETFLRNKSLKLRAEIEFQIALMNDEGILSNGTDKDRSEKGMYEWATQKAPYFRHLINENPEMLYTFYRQNRHLPVNNSTGSNSLIADMKKRIEDLRKKTPISGNFQS